MGKKIQAYILRSFVKKEKGGNGAAVIPEAEKLTEAEMQSLAKTLAFSETAFVLPSEKADLRLRFFTPEEEVDLCGHATLAAFHLLHEQRRLSVGRWLQETKAGFLSVEIEEKGAVFMEQNCPQFFERIPRDIITELLKLGTFDLNPELPAQIVSTGLRDILIPIRNRETLNRLSPDFQKMTVLSQKYGVAGLHLFSLERTESLRIHARNFAPLLGIPEESATGTSNGALAAYLYRYGCIKKEEAAELRIFQGESMGQSSEILVRLETEAKEILEVWAGGQVQTLEKRELPFPVRC